MDTAKLSISQDSLTYQLISKKHGSVTRYYLRNMCLSSDILISKEDALKFVAQNIPSIEDSYREVKNIAEKIAAGDFPDTLEIDNVEYSEDSFFGEENDTLTAEDVSSALSQGIDDIGDTVVVAHVSLKPAIDARSQLVDQSSSEDSNPTMSTLTVKDLEELTSLKEENQSLKIQNQDLMTQLASLQGEQEQTSKDLQVSEEVNSNLRSQLSTYREELVSSRKELEALEKEVEPLLDKFKQAKEHSDKMMDFVGFQDQRINELEDMLVEFRIKRSE